jgi:hypothetical protein
MTQPEGISGLFHGIRLLATRTGFILERPESAEAVRKGDESLCGSAGSAVGFAGGYIFIRRGAQAALIAWMSGCTPRMAIIRFRL